MGISVRHYLLPVDGEPLRISKRVANGLIFETDAIPHLAGTKQRVLTAILKNEEGEASHLLKVEGAIWHFDADGKIHDGLADGLREAMNAWNFGKFGEVDEKVVDLHPRINRRRQDDRHRWEPTPAHIELVVADIWPKKGVRRYKELKGIAPKAPAITSDARHRLGEITRGFWKIQIEIDHLSEPSLKGFAYEARRLQAIEDDDGPLYTAIAQMAERRLEILKRRRSEKGVWIASVEVMRRHPDGHGETTHQFYQRCQGRTKAVEAARRLLVEHSDKFTSEQTIEAAAVPDIEWRELFGAQEVDESGLRAS